jgi:hypothetical protein
MSLHEKLTYARFITDSYYMAREVSFCAWGFSVIFESSWFLKSKNYYYYCTIDRETYSLVITVINYSHCMKEATWLFSSQNKNKKDIYFDQKWEWKIKWLLITKGHLHLTHISRMFGIKSLAFKNRWEGDICNQLLDGLIWAVNWLKVLHCNGQ